MSNIRTPRIIRWILVAAVFGGRVAAPGIGRVTGSGGSHVTVLAGSG